MSLGEVARMFWYANILGQRPHISLAVDDQKYGVDSSHGERLNVRSLGVGRALTIRSLEGPSWVIRTLGWARGGRGVAADRSALYPHLMPREPR